MVHSWIGLTILACLPCMGTLRSIETQNSYTNSQKKEGHYESALLSSKMVGQTSLPPALHHKEKFAYESCWSTTLHGVACMAMLCYPVTRIEDCLRRRKGCYDGPTARTLRR